MVSSTALRMAISRDFLLLWVAEVISGFGDRVTVVALAFVAWELTHSAAPTAFAFVISSFAYGLFGLVAGAVGDALGHRRAMILSDVARAGVIAAVPVSLVLGAPLALCYGLVFVATLFSAIFTPAKFALVPSVVPKHALGSTNSLLYASDRTVEIAGVAVAGLLVAALGTAAFVVDSISFVLSALLLSQLRVQDVATGRFAPEHVITDAARGLRALFGDAVLRANTIYALLAQLSLPVFNALLPVFVFREYGLGAEQLGLAQSAIAIGSVGMGTLYPLVLGRLRTGTEITLGFVLFGGFLLALSTLPGYALTLPILALIGAANVVFLIPNVTLLQERTSPELRARVFAARLSLRNLSWLPVILATSAVSDLVGAGGLLAVAGSFTLLVVAVGTRFAAVRDA